MSSQYAQDLSYAESQTPFVSEEQRTTNRQPSPTKNLSSPTETVSSGDNGLESEDDSPYSKHVQSYSTIWSLYLKERGIEDKEVANSLKVGVDDVPLFGALFGGVITAFLIESRKDLQVGPVQEIL
ncbi:hypothetical protein BU17DRAFT_98973 [Hysterangium stoloniferum]|nr:hypothetical protein BU17DRAFT_98973 [Hysterangium stoloniferum]